MTDSECSANKRLRSENSMSESSELVLRSDQAAKCSVLSREVDEALQESTRRHVKPVIDEAKLGIELFVGDTKNQYHGLIKTRYADFIVHEIDLDGKIAELTDLEPPEEEEPTSSMKLEDFFDRKSLVCMSNVNSGLLESYQIDVTGMDKDMRTSLHHAIRASYDRLDSATISESDISIVGDGQNGNKKESEESKAPDSTQQVYGEKESSGADTTHAPEKGEEKKYIVVKRRGKNSRQRSIWPRTRPDYTHFVLYKENKDTMDAIHNLSAATGVKPANFSYAGTKDRRAVTTQWVSSWRLEPKRLLGAVRRFNKRPFIKVGNFCFKKEAIRLGQLRANKFDIVIRHLVHNSEGLKVIEEAMTSVMQRGFVNYFGLQRFGTRSIQTHQVGLAVLQAKWEQAVDLILSYRYDDNTQVTQNSQGDESVKEKVADTNNGSSQTNNSETQKPQHRQNRSKWTGGAEQHNICIDLWKSKYDADLVFKKYPHFRITNEGLIIKSLSEHEKSCDYHRALSALPRNTRSMYVHSYQSLLWNKLTSYRLKKHGYKVIPGDLILIPDCGVSDSALDLLLATDELETTDNIDTPEPKDGDEHPWAVGTDDRKFQAESIESKIVIATEENLNNFSIFDVVLPLIGSRTKIPTNDTGNELERLLKEDELTIESFKAREKVFVSYGSYRKIMVKPNNLSWTIKQYSHPYENLILTDLDRLSFKERIQDVSSTQGDLSDEALLVSFELPPSSYATMCLREMMKKPSTDFNNRF